MAKTTLIFDDACMEKVRKLAQAQGRTMTELVNEMLAEGISRREERAAQPPLDLPKFSMGVARADIADRDALEDVLSGS